MPRTLPVWSELEHVPASVPGPGRVDLYVAKASVTAVPTLLVEGYDGDARLLVAGTLAIWELNQALAALIAPGGQARRLAVHDDGRANEGYVDLVCTDGEAQVVLIGRDHTTVAFTASRAALAADVQQVLRHYLRLSRAVTPGCG